MREFVTFIADYLDVPAPTRQVPAAFARAAAVVMEWVARAVGAKTPPPLNRSRLRFLYYNQRFSIEKARRELGYEPQISYREGLPPALDWIQAVERSKQSEDPLHEPSQRPTQLQGS
jgi:nucleoside-diphosphate-sugar epimerase